MNKKLILCAPIAMVLASCSTTRMGYVVPESRDTDFEGIAVQGWNTGSVITYGKNYKTGYMETANVTVYQDSGIDNAAKLATAAGTLAWGAGTVMEGIGALEYADAFHEYATAHKRIAHDGGYGSHIEIHGGSGSGASATASATATASAMATGGGDWTNTNGGPTPQGNPMPPCD